MTAYAASFTGINFTKRQSVSQSVSELLTSIANDRTRVRYKQILPDSSLTECHTIVKSAYLLCSRGPASLHVAMHNEMAMLSFKKMKEAFLECRACLRMPTCSLSATLYWHFLTLPPPCKPSPTPFLE